MSEEFLGMLFLLALIPLLALWPYFYIRFKKGQSHFLFVAAFYGAFVVTGALLSAIAFPFEIFLVKLVPQLEVLGLASYLKPLIQVCEAIADWYWIVLFPVLYVALPPLLYRRYGEFRSTSR